MIQLFVSVVNALSSIKLKALELRQQKKPAAIVERLLREQLAMAEVYREKLDALHKYHADLESQRMREAFERGITLRELFQDDMRQGIEAAKSAADKEWGLRKDHEFDLRRAPDRKEEMMREEFAAKERARELVEAERMAQLLGHEREVLRLQLRIEQLEKELANKATP